MTSYDAAVNALLQEYHWNPWFLDTSGLKTHSA